jgi:uncharacterized ubiquitin-like protein YukD
MKRDKIYVCIKGPGKDDEIDMVLAQDQIIQDFMKICTETLGKEISSIKVNHPFEQKFVLLDGNRTFFEEKVSNGDILLLT